MHLVPFTVTIPPERRDKRLLERLLEERDGILGWLIDGYAEWRETGLAPPASVIQSAEEYFADEDLFGQWIDERCDVSPTCRETARALFLDWSGWAQGVGVEPGSQKTLGDGLRDRGFTSRKLGGQRGWFGIALRRKASQDGDAE
jgi:putative DNA primase/helicase